MSQVESSIFELGAGGMIVYSTITMVLEVPQFFGWSNVTFDSNWWYNMGPRSIAKVGLYLRKLGIMVDI